MSRDVSTTFKTAVNAQETGEVFLVLLTIEHDDLDEPIRVVNNQVNITSRGNEYLASAFQLTFPGEKDGEPPRAQLTIDNVDRRIVQAVRDITSPPSVSIEVILASAPNTVEASYTGMVFSDVSYDKLSVQGTITHEDILSEPFPADKYQPAGFPALFAR